MGEWNRGTAWAQGMLLSLTDVKRLGLSLAEYPDSTLALVVSHDCDIANDDAKEPDVEIIVGHVIAPPNPNNLFAKNPRLLELPFQGTEVFYAQFDVRTRLKLRKKDLQPCSPETALLERDDLRVLQRWLASRYDRPAFPDDFDLHLKAKKLDRKLKELGDTHGRFVSGLLFDLRPNDEGYDLEIVVLYVPKPDPNTALEQARNYAKAIEEAFNKKLFDTVAKTWDLVELTRCYPISEDDLTLSQYRDLQRWNLDAVSYAADPQQALMPD